MTDSVLIIGAGIAGLTAAQEVAAAGARAIVVEQRPIIGGRLAATMTASDGIGDRAEGAAVPLFDAIGANDRIEIITNGTVTAVNGRLTAVNGQAGSFDVAVTEKARFVTDACTRCKLCHGVCPVVLPNEYDAGLTFRKAIFTPMLKTWPDYWVIDIDSCLNTPPNYLPCNRCVEVCDDNAIHFDQAVETVHRRHVGAIIVATGIEAGDGAGFEDLGYGSHPDIVTSAEMQRLLESPGPTGGYAMRPSNEEYPESVLIILDEPSAFSLYIAASQAQQLLAQDVEDVTVLVLSQPSSTDAAESLLQKTGIKAHWGTACQVAGESDGPLQVSFEDFTEKKLVRMEFDMIVLCVDVEPATDNGSIAEMTGLSLSENGYLSTAGDGIPGVFVIGCAAGPRNIRDSMTDAKEAAEASIRELSPRVLEDPAEAEAMGIAAPDAASIEMRAQIEQLLHALIDRP